MDSQVFTQKVNSLPPLAQEHLYSYLDFLVEKYQKEEEELSEEGKSFLKERLSQMKASPEKNISWDDLEKQLNQEFQWEE